MRLARRYDRKNAERRFSKQLEYAWPENNRKLVSAVVMRVKEFMDRIRFAKKPGNLLMDYPLCAQSWQTAQYSVNYLVVKFCLTGVQFWNISGALTVLGV
jgi:hypothetical protein